MHEQRIDYELNSFKTEIQKAINDGEGIHPFCSCMQREICSFV